MSEKADKNIVVTIGREFASGGRELGRKIADRLGYAYYDKELLSRAAAGSGFAEEYVRENDERSPGLISAALSFAMHFSPMSWYQVPTADGPANCYTSQSEVIEHIAEEGSCVIVGRTADYVLRDHPRTVNVFVHAPIESCIDRLMERAEMPDRDKARAHIEKQNKLRAEYYNFYTDKRWGDSRSYDLTFDTSLISIDDIADIVADYVRRRFKIDATPDVK